MKSSFWRSAGRHRRSWGICGTIALLEGRVLLTEIGVHRGRQFTQDVNGNRMADAVADREFNFGNPDDIPVVGDWNGDGFDEVGVFRTGTWYFDINGNSRWDGATGGDLVVPFGIAGDIPYVGDWNGDGAVNIGVVRNGYFYLDSNENGVWDGMAGGDYYGRFGNASDIPIAGDWGGFGRDNIGVFRDGMFYMDVNGNGIWEAASDARFAFGNPGDVPVIGDWNGDLIADVGVVRSGFWYLDQNGSRSWDNTGGGDAWFIYGNATDRPIVGEWRPQVVFDRGSDFSSMSSAETVRGDAVESREANQTLYREVASSPKRRAFDVSPEEMDDYFAGLVV